MSNHTRIVIPEQPGPHRLGRHVWHDERSRAFAVPYTPGPIKSVTWPRHCPIFDQGELGSCTGNAMAGALMTGNLWDGHMQLSESDAVSLYSDATHYDRLTGVYPPTDSGSTGLAVCRAASKRGWISAYHHAFGLDQALHALARGPIITGVDWFSGFDNPQGDRAELVISGDVRGGHEMVVDMLDVENGYIGGHNSWGPDWGDHGQWVMSFGTWAQLLKRRGDATAPVK